MEKTLYFPLSNLLYLAFKKQKYHIIRWYFVGAPLAEGSPNLLGIMIILAHRLTTDLCRPA
jgi:hypothetical protein